MNLSKIKKGDKLLISWNSYHYKTIKFQVTGYKNGLIQILSENNSYRYSYIELTTTEASSIQMVNEVDKHMCEISSSSDGKYLETDEILEHYPQVEDVGGYIDNTNDLDKYKNVFFKRYSNDDETKFENGIIRGDSIVKFRNHGYNSRKFRYKKYTNLKIEEYKGGSIKSYSYDYFSIIKGEDLEKDFNDISFFYVREFSPSVIKEEYDRIMDNTWEDEEFNKIVFIKGVEKQEFIVV